MSNDEIKVQEAIQKEIASLGEGDTVPVDCDECGEWNGHDRRCTCGNRRCYWDYFDDGGGNIQVFPAVD